MKYTVKAFGKRGSQYGPSHPANDDELIGAVARMIKDLRNPCFESEITVEIKEVK